MGKLINTFFNPQRKALTEGQGLRLDGQDQGLAIIFTPEPEKIFQG